MADVKPVPDGWHTVTPHLVVNGAADALAFYVRAFRAEVVMQVAGLGGVIVHAEIRIGDSLVMLAEEMPEMGHGRSPRTLGGNHSSLMIYATDCDAAFTRAVDAGAEAMMPPADMFWGDRYCQVKDPFGHTWAIATHVEDVLPDEIARRMAQMGH